MYNAHGSVSRSWTCTTSDCTCGGDGCDKYTLGDPEEASSMCPIFNNCRYMDTVKYMREDGYKTGVCEIAIIGRLGEMFSYDIIS